uniref:HP domain-containing protein n=1 Tax=Syphacia muris TaxID=451379 RepID=A0A0N5AH59_9BILA
LNIITSKAIALGLEAKIDFASEVQLKKREVASGYPDVMLIRIKGSKRPDFRLVAPKYTSLCNYGVYVLVLPDKLFSYTGKYANLREKTQATIMLKSITTKKGELGCNARVSENVNEARKSEFWKLLGCTGAKDIVDNEERNAIFEGEEPFENFIAKVNLVFSIGSDCSIERILTGEAPKSEILQPSANLIFDFGSEIYVWSGRSADRKGFLYAMTYAKQLVYSNVLFGDDFSEKRPEWCIMYKISQGLADSLFRNKFVDWKVKDGEVVKIKKPKPEKTAELASESYEESLATKLAKSLELSIPTETKLVLEDTELDRGAENIYTDDIHFYLVEGETELKELENLRVLNRMQCYIVKWNYRVEREDEEDRDTGRQRVCYFFWLGSGTTNKDQGVCALAVRNFDRERQPHERVVQGQEPFMFLARFNGSLITVGYETRIFLVHSSHFQRECYLEELPEPVVLRSHAAYVFAKDKIIVWYGNHSTEKEKACAKLLAESLLEQKDEYFNCIDKAAGMKSAFSKLWLKLLLLILSFLDFRDTMIVDQGTGIWLWTEVIVTTQHLRVASMYAKERLDFATVICKTKEPEAFKALFPMWKDFVDKIPERSDPITVEELLKQRNQKFPLEKVLARDLPKGFDLKRLEQYLTDEDFEKVFKMSRSSFYALPHWKQIKLRKSNDLF